MLSREDEWVWDSWYVVDNSQLHAFYLMAPKSLGNPDLRHVNARVGHSVSHDGMNWEHLPDALGPSSTPHFDDQAIWTGSIVKIGSLWHMFYTGISATTQIRRQAIGLATSTDLMSWTRVSPQPILVAQPPLALLDNEYDGSEHFRDPWVFSHENQWHMLITASDNDGWGTVAHATSGDALNWDLQHPLVTRSQLKQIEVTQTICVDGVWFLIFCAGASDIQRTGVTPAFGTYCVPAESPVGPFDFDRARVLAEGIYAGRVVNFNNTWFLLGFIDSGEPGDFTGVICDPIEIMCAEDGLLISAQNLSQHR